MVCFVLTVGFLAAPQLLAQAGDQKSAGSDAQPGSQATVGTEAYPGTRKTRLTHPIHIVPLVLPSDSAAPVRENAVAGARVTYFGGPVVSNVHVVIVLYGAGGYLANIASTTPPSAASFFTDIPASSLFDMLSEYNTAGVTAADGSPGTNQTIGHGFFDGQFTITPSAANNGDIITDQQIQAELLSQVAAGNLPQPVFDAGGNNNTLYMIFFPPGKTITMGNLASCTNGGFCAYHSNTAGLKSLLYGVMPDMQPPSLCSVGCARGVFDVVTSFDLVTHVAAHELSEAVTDAEAGTANTLARPLAWFDQFNGEIGDICTGTGGRLTVNGQTYAVQLEFSEFQNNCVAEPPQFVFLAPFTNITPGVEFNVPVALRSGAGNVIFAGNYAGTVHFTSNDPKALLPADYTFNTADSAATHSFVFTLNTPGNNQTITATDTTRPLLTGTTQPITVANPIATSFDLSYPQTAISGTPVSFTIAARDRNGNSATSYQGPVHFTSTDAAAILPPDSPLTNGRGTFAITFNTVSFLTSVTVQDANSGLPSGQTQDLNVYTPGSNATTTTFTAGQNPSTFGTPVTYSATVTGGSGTFISSVVFTSEGFQVASGFVDATGHAQSMLNLLGGTHTIFAEFSGDQNHTRSSSVPLTVVVNPAPISATASSSSPSSVFGSAVTLTATLSSAASIPGVSPGGLITFRDGGKPLAVVAPATPFSPGGTFSTNSLSVGSHSITADYSGDQNYASTTSAAFLQVVTPAPAADYTIQPDKNSATLRAGQSATFVITATSLNGFSGDVRFACSNLPALTTCTFTPSTTFVGTNLTATTTLRVVTTGPNALLLQPAQPRYYAALLGSLAFSVMLLVGSRRPKLKIRGALLLVLLAVLLPYALTSCGGGGSESVTPTPTPTPMPATPAGTTMFSVSSTARPDAASANPATPNQQFNLSITVQP